MHQPLSAANILILIIPPLLWAGNAVVGRWVHDLVPPMTLNLLRWVLAFMILLPLAWPVLRPASPVWPGWRRYTVLGLLAIGLYNALQYLALKTSAPMNVTLVAASSPVWMLGVGWLGFGQRVSPRQMLGAVLSIAGVAVVLSRGEPAQLAALRLVPGDLYVLVATASWAVYSWMLSQPRDPPGLRGDWAAFLMAQLIFGLGWAGLFAAAEWTLTPAVIHWGWPLALALAYVAIGPAIISYRCFALGVQRVGPAMAGFFGNLTPLFAALLSAAFLGEPPRLYHGLAFALIVGGIVVSVRRTRA